MKKGKSAITQTPKQDTDVAKKKPGGRRGRKSEKSAPASPLSVDQTVSSAADNTTQPFSTAEDQIVSVTDESNATSSESKASVNLPLPVVELEKSDISTLSRGSRKVCV